MISMDIDFDFTKDYTYVTVHGKYNLQDDHSIVEKIVSHKKLNKYIPIIIDCSAVDFSQITYELIQMASHHDIAKNSLQEHKIAIVTASELAFDIISQWYGSQSKNKEYPTEVFLDLHQAKQWLAS